MIVDEPADESPQPSIPTIAPLRSPSTLVEGVVEPLGGARPGEALFTPDPRDLHSLIELLGSIDHTLREIAESHETTVEALTLWMQTPEISRRLDAIESATTRRARLVANNYLACAVEPLAECIASATHEEKHVPVQTSSLAALEQRRRSRETLRKCVALLQRLAHHTPARSWVGRPSEATPTPPTRPYKNNKLLAG